MCIVAICGEKRKGPSAWPSGHCLRGGEIDRDVREWRVGVVTAVSVICLGCSLPGLSLSGELSAVCDCLFQVTHLGSQPCRHLVVLHKGQYSHSLCPGTNGTLVLSSEDTVESSAVQSLGHWVKSQAVSHYFKLPVGRELSSPSGRLLPSLGPTVPLGSGLMD